jgi:predicted ATP-dependent endonuclease of OLD family
MINSIKIVDSDLIKTKVLSNLGQINIICGKNNSGKTFLLKSLFHEDAKIGKIVDSNEFGKTLIKQLNPYPAELIPICQKFVKENLRFEDDLYFEGENDILVGKFPQNFEVSSQHFHGGNVHGAFEAIFHSFRHDSKMFLIPAKRNIENDISVNGRTDPFKQPDGLDKIVPHISYLKNQQPGSESRLLYEKLQQKFKEISGGIAFDVISNPENTVSLEFCDNGQWLKAEKCGLGLQDLLIIIFVCISPQYSVIGIEEPENHIHPEIQRELLQFLKSTDKQYFITTHSSVFLDSKYADSIYMTRKEEKIEVIEVSDKAELLTNLGYSVIDNLVSKLIILVEGPSDVPVINEFAKILGIDSKINFKMWPLGGDIMDKLDLSVLSQNFKLLALIDKDPGSAKIREKFKKKCRDARVEFFQLERYAIENYFTLTALRLVFPNQINESIREINPMQKLENQIGFDVKKNNKKIAQNMTLEDIQATDLKEFFEKLIKVAGETPSTEAGNLEARPVARYVASSQELLESANAPIRD